MRALDRKLLRDLVRMKWQMAAIALLIACGVSVAVMAFSAQKALIVAQRRYYEQTRFGELFATATRAPLALVGDLKRIDGVTAVDARAMKAGLMDVPGLLRPATAHLIALPDDEAGALNRIVIVAGRSPDPRRTDEAVALTTFLDAAHVVLGERLSMVIAGRRTAFTIVGAALSPEFVYAPSNGPMPDDAHTGVFWAPRVAVEHAAGLRGAFSTVSLALAPGAPIAPALNQIDRLLARYGGAPAYARADQISHKFQTDRIQRLAVIAAIIPPVFLVVAASLVHLVLGRMVDTEREQIGLLKAFGYRDAEAAAVYVKMAAVVGLAGVAAGGVFGGWMSRLIVAQLAKYMRFPRLDDQFSWTAFAVAALFSVAAAVAGSIRASIRASRLSPAVAMQPPMPAAFRRGVIERTPVWRGLDQPTRIIVRNLERYPGRAFVTVAGLAVSLSLLVGSQFVYGNVDGVIDQAYYRARRWTHQIAFSEHRAVHAIEEIRRLPAVVHVEPFRRVAARARAHGRNERVVIVGLEPDAELGLPLDPSGARLSFRGRGVAVSQALAAHLRLRTGDAIDVEVTEGLRPHVVLPVASIAQDYAGLTIQMSRHALNDVMGDGDLASGADLLVATDRRAAFYRAIAAAPAVVAAGSRDDTVESFRSAITGAMLTEMAFFLGFAAAIAFGVAYNISRIALADRARDLATLQVLGFRPIECAYILAGELALLALVAAPLGAAGGYGLGGALIQAFTKQDFFLPFYLSPGGLGLAFLTYAAAVALAAWLVVLRIWQLDLVTVLKTRD